ncbi:hypothetical protein GGF31_006799 [Allomyces arbusculus]|nr:hypothetical protein GGF31_006799 [Allomyces arbusculus]
MSGVTALLGALVDDDSISADTYIREMINTVSAIEMYSKTNLWNPADMPVLQTMYSAHTDADGIIQRIFDVQDVDAGDAVLKPLLTAPPAQDIKDPLGDMASAAMDLTWTMTCVPADLTDKAHRGLRQPDPQRETVQGVLDTLRDLAQVVRGVANVLPQRVLGAAKNLPPEEYPGLTDYLVKETNRAVAQMNQASLALAGAGLQHGGGPMDLVKSWRESSAYRRIRLIRDDRPSHDVLDAFHESPWVGYRNWARDLAAVHPKPALVPRDNGRNMRHLFTLQFDDLGSSVDNGSCLKMTGSEVSLLAKITVDLADISQYFSYWGTTVCGTVQYLCPDPIAIQGTLRVDRNYNVVNTTIVVRPLSSSSRASQTPGPCSPLSGRDRVRSFNNDHYSEQWTERQPTLCVQHFDELQVPPLYYHHGKSESEYFDPRVVRLMQKPQPEQRTPEWYETRRGSITASNMASDTRV